MVVVAIVLVVVGESPPPVDTLGFDDEHAAPSKARATTHAASPARRRVIGRSGERDGANGVEVSFVMPISTAGSPVRFTPIACSCGTTSPPGVIWCRKNARRARQSSLRMVAVPVESAAVTPTTVLPTSENVSFFSFRRSPSTATSTVWDCCPAANVSTVDASAT